MGGAAGAAGQATGGTAGAAGDATGGAAGQAVGGAAGAAGQATGGSGGGTTSCDNSGTCQTCAECSWQTGSCVDEYNACAGNNQCVGLWDCLNQCPANDDTCVNNCATTYSTGVDPYLALIDCTICTDCPVDCDGPGSGCGAGGAGGTGGSGGGGTGGAAGTGGSGGGTTSCDNSGTCQTCAECSWQTGSCVDEYSSCANNTQCVGLWDCLGNCAAGDDTCVNNCATTYSAGVDPYVTLIDCTICTDCPVDCDGPGSGCGAGGAGGTGGSGGGGTGGAAGTGGTGGSGGGTTSCDNSGTCQTCAECSWQTGSCVDEYNSCVNNNQCVGLWDCLGNCAVGDDACVNTCATTYAGGVDPYVTLIDCTICTDCPVDCDGPGSGCGAGGSGGTGGSGGSGGSTQVCDDLATCAACKQCAVNGNCADELAACSASTACTTLQTCLAGCSNQGCINKCRNNNAGGTALYDALQGCNCTECSTACTAADGCP